MANLSIKDVPERWAEALRQRAARNHRSLQGELMNLVEQAIVDQPVGLGSPMAAKSSDALPPVGQVVGFDRLGLPITRRGSKTIEQIYAEHIKRFPQPFTEGPMSVDIVRQDRDRR
ncbi:FitA-like ribbon-helix-helix domain-containing protein [Rhodoferax sp.]|uniref:FitA-like ribbon-helix-helix domain-containing protein n=1 Tax=Rhodoferax sp. TaxID=50421 RepID=UPI0027471FD5|nr:Arc family DNA-binding protein [Rhodoferax sp.]